MPVYNREFLITKSLDSVKFQKNRPIEIIVVDDGSTFKTGDVVKNWNDNNYANDDLQIKYCY